MHGSFVANLPKGSRIAIESYAPFVDPAVYRVQGYGAMIVHSPEWYVTNGFDYPVFSQGMYGRFYREPEKYADSVSQYNAFFDRFRLVRQFADDGYEVRLYAVAPQ